jgi:AI-2 transport protein TqsA
MDEEARQRRIQTVCLLILAAVATGATLYWLSSVMIPFVLALFFAYALSPLVDMQMSYLRFPRGLAVLLTLVLSALALSSIGGLVTSSVGQLSANRGAYERQVQELFRQTQDFLRLERFGFDPLAEVDLLSMIPADGVAGVLLSMTNSIVDLFSQGLVVLIFLFFLLLGASGSRAPEDGLRAAVDSRIKRYILVQGSISAVTGILIGLILSLLGIPLAMVFGLFAFLLNFIPSLGSIIATLLPLPVVLVSPDISFTAAVLAIALPGGVQFLIGSVISPKIMGDSLDLDPVVVLLALMIWGALWGVVGMLLAAPITAVLKILLERIEFTAPAAELMAGRMGGATKDPEAAAG